MQRLYIAVLSALQWENPKQKIQFPKSNTLCEGILCIALFKVGKIYDTGVYAA